MDIFVRDIHNHQIIDVTTNLSFYALGYERTVQILIEKSESVNAVGDPLLVVAVLKGSTPNQFPLKFIILCLICDLRS